LFPHRQHTACMDLLPFTQIAIIHSQSSSAQRLQSMRYVSAEQLDNARARDPGVQMDATPNVFGASLSDIRDVQAILLVAVPVALTLLFLFVFTLVKLVWACKRCAHRRRMARMYARVLIRALSMHRQRSQQLENESMISVCKTNVMNAANDFIQSHMCV
jgi:hypothetical protein